MAAEKIDGIYHPIPQSFKLETLILKLCGLKDGIYHPIPQSFKLETLILKLATFLSTDAFVDSQIRCMLLHTYVELALCFR